MQYWLNSIFVSVWKMKFEHLFQVFPNLALANLHSYTIYSNQRILLIMGSCLCASQSSEYQPTECNCGYKWLKLITFKESSKGNKSKYAEGVWNQAIACYLFATSPGSLEGTISRSDAQAKPRTQLNVYPSHGFVGITEEKDCCHCDPTLDKQ